jgi:hypothetical protein
VGKLKNDWTGFFSVTFRQLKLSLSLNTSGDEGGNLGQLANAEVGEFADAGNLGCGMT